MAKGIQIGEVGNYYGNLYVRTFRGRFQWSIKNHDGHNWKNITAELYHALLIYEAQRKK